MLGKFANGGASGVWGEREGEAPLGRYGSGRRQMGMGSWLNHVKDRCSQPEGSSRIAQLITNKQTPAVLSILRETQMGHDTARGGPPRKNALLPLSPPFFLPLFLSFTDTGRR